MSKILNRYHFDIVDNSKYMHRELLAFNIVLFRQSYWKIVQLLATVSKYVSESEDGHAEVDLTVLSHYELGSACILF
jgi:hypothetical protein